MAPDLPLAQSWSHHLFKESEANSHVSRGDARVMMIYTGGTIGMVKGESGYEPKANRLADALRQDSRFNDPLDTKSKRGDLLTTPLTKYKKKIYIKIHEYSPLLDSCNMTMREWVKIATDIETYYNDFDGFVILHGTDTMAYTASALSFLFNNLGKCVILTGSQIPICELRNDAFDNLMGAITLAGHFIIPEVCVYFHNKLYRGNRCSKVSSDGFDAFASPNLYPIASVGIDVKINWHLLRIIKGTHKFFALKNVEPGVTAMTLFPGMSHEMVTAMLQEPIRGVALCTLGAGNVPDQNTQLIEALRRACERGVVIVNITQCAMGGVSAAYATGSVLQRIGVVLGG
eukprot:GHVN01029885.1.p1 GENE.GHVN01029885.1~~GHVN01029885.1.p1  ORF type:complete len:402 (-),score=78.21 GHVN01029885.1:399-1433(-)